MCLKGRTTVQLEALRYLGRADEEESQRIPDLLHVVDCSCFYKMCTSEFAKSREDSCFIC